MTNKQQINSRIEELTKLADAARERARIEQTPEARKAAIKAWSEASVFVSLHRPMKVGSRGSRAGREQQARRRAGL